MTTENITTSKKRRMRRRTRINKIDEIKSKIESDAKIKVIEMNTNINSFNIYSKSDMSNLLLNIMQTGTNEFKEKTGRNITYSEMREMFG